LWGFNPMKAADVARAFDNLAKQRAPLTAAQRQLMRQLAQQLRQNRRTTAKHNPASECIGTLEELRYHRTIGKNPGYYKHVYRSRPRVWCLADGSVWIEPKGKR
jgi:hypothetical protein